MLLIYLDSFRGGGLHRQMYVLVRGLLREHKQVKIVVSDSKGDLKDYYLNSGCDIEELGWSGRVSVSYLRSLKRTIGREDTTSTVLFIPLAQNLAYYVLLRIFGQVPKYHLISSVRGMTFWKKPDGVIERVFEHIFCRMAVLFSDKIVFNSNTSRESFLLKFPNASIKTRLIYNAIGKEWLDSQRYYCPSKSVKLVHVARLDPWKDNDTLIRAVHILSSQMEISLDIYGYGVEYRRLTKLINDLNLTKIVRIISGKVVDSKVLSKYSHACLCSFGEGMSNSLMEYMAYGLPVICSRIPSNTEMLGENYPYLYEAGNVDDCCQNLIDMIKAENTNLVKQNIYKISTFTEANMIKKYTDLICEF